MKLVNSRRVIPKEHYMSVIYSGCSIDYRGITLCNLANSYQRMNMGNEYQVWSDKLKEYHLYKNVSDAVDKFIELIDRI